MSINETQFVQLLKDAGLVPQAYSGRGMYGQQCVAVTETEDGQDLGIAELVEIGWKIRQAAVDTLEDEWAVDSVVRFIETVRTDSLGRGMVIYFPNAAWIEDDEQND